MLLTIYHTTRHHVSDDHSLKPYWLSQVQNCEETALALRDCGKVTVAI